MKAVRFARLHGYPLNVFVIWLGRHMRSAKLNHFSILLYTLGAVFLIVGHSLSGSNGLDAGSLGETSIRESDNELAVYLWVQEGHTDPLLAMEESERARTETESEFIKPAWGWLTTLTFASFYFWSNHEHGVVTIFDRLWAVFLSFLGCCL